MNKYRDALYRLDDGEHTIEDFELLKKLAKEKDEQESRKDKLVVGSEWECVADCYGDKIAYYKNANVILNKFDENLLEIISFEKSDRMKKDQFLLCFKPKEKADE